MDLSFTRTIAGRGITTLPVELAVLLVGVATRQATSLTARAQAPLVARRLGGGLLRPESGAFSAITARALIGWQRS